METDNSSSKQSDIGEEVLLQIKEKLGEVNRQLLTMDWDKRHNQFNPGMEAKYSQLKAEHDTLVKKLSGEA